MPSLKTIRQKIDSIKSTRQVTSAMKMVSAAKLQRAQQAILNARPYSDELNEILLSLATRTPSNIHPLLRTVSPDEVKSIGLIVVTADKGLCGAFNLNIIKATENVINKYKGKKVELICVGKKGWRHFIRAGYTIREKYLEFFDKLEFHHSGDIMELIVSAFLAEEYDKVIVVYNEFKSAIQQRIVERQLLPFEIQEKEVKPLPPYTLEPDSLSLLEEFIRKHLDVQIWRILLESSSAEQGARMTAMDSATDNADELIEELTVAYNRKRQESITTAIIEVASAAEAMKG
jgi:F-type H+-transporting ATPase subunit gamma